MRSLKDHRVSRWLGFPTLARPLGSGVERGAWVGCGLVGSLYSTDLLVNLEITVDSRIFVYTRLMDPIQNPYAPGAGTPPPLLAGREDLLRAFDVVIGRAAAGRSFQPPVLSGLRGVGKTVLLLQFRAAAVKAGWVAEMFEVRPGSDLWAQVADALPPMVRSVNRRWRNKQRALHIGRIAAGFVKGAAATLTRGSVELSYEPAPGIADSGDFETDLTELLTALGEGAREEGVGAALLIDELQDAPLERLAALAGAAHRINQDQLPVVIGGAGLPPVGRILSEARSYSERLFSIRPIGKLNDDDSSLALAEPAQHLGVAYEADALCALVEASGGYPFFIQAHGKHAWDRAQASPITRDDIEEALPLAYRELSESFFKPRYDRATPAERSYLHAMADIDADPAPSSEVTRRLGHKEPARASPLRDSLIGKGLVYAPERGRVAFTVPNMATYLRSLPIREA